MLSQEEFDGILEDIHKTIEGDIRWQEDEDHSPAVEFRANVSTADGWPLFVYGNYHGLLNLLSYVLILPPAGRVYALDLGKDHRNPDGEHTGEKHKHCYREQYGDKYAYVPDDITEEAVNPVGVWKQFCREAKIQHNGKMYPPPPTQEELFW
jgi:hypothetical protein